MCGGSKIRSSQSGCIIDEDEYEKKQKTMPHNLSDLLEFSASDDVMSFKHAVEKEGHDVDEVGLWYGRRVGSKKMCYEERTPLMIAAMFGSINVLSYILGTNCVDVNRVCGSDRATALHCAVSGGSCASLKVIKLLLDAFADVSVVDANGNRSSDLIVSLSHSIFNSRKRAMQAILEGREEGIDDEARLTFEDKVSQMEKIQHQETYEEEKEDPLDLSLPNIKNGIYSTDEFRMYTFKVKPCSRAYYHDWTECPFVHPGENARRRDPRIYRYSCVPCLEFRKGSCSKGDSCEYAHGIFECWLHPAQYRTRLCKDETRCTRRVCFFAHKPEELRPLYASTGSALPSLMSSYSSGGANSLLENGSVSPFTLGSPSALIPPAQTQPMTPSGSSNTVTILQNQSHVGVPTLQMSLLKTALNSRDIDLDMELLALENHQLVQQVMVDDMTSLSIGTQVQLGGYSSHLSSSNVIGSPEAAVSFNQKNSTFSKRCQSFVDLSLMSHNSEHPSPPPPPTSIAMEPCSFSGWGSPGGKLDWSIRGEELKRLRKSASVGFLNMNNSPSNTMPPNNVDEPDVSWVHSLVKDSPSLECAQYSIEEQRQNLQSHLGNGNDAIPTWLEPLCIDQDQMVS